MKWIILLVVWVCVLGIGCASRVTVVRGEDGCGYVLTAPEVEWSPGIARRAEYQRVGEIGVGRPIYYRSRSSPDVFWKAGVR